MRFWAEERAMRTTRFWTCASLVATAALLSTGVASADDISGLITTTRTITANSRLVGDVTCRVTGAPCILFGSSHIELRLNGFTMTGQANPVIGCNGGMTAGEMGISILSGDNNLVDENTAYGNTNGIIIFPPATNTRVRGNVAVGNPPLQQSTGVPGTAGVDIWDQSAPGATSFDKNICVTSINAPCPNLAPSQ